MDNDIKCSLSAGRIMQELPRESTKHERLAKAVHRFDEINYRLEGLRDRLTNSTQETPEGAVAGS